MSLIFCLCGCGKEIEEFDSHNRRRKYIHNHHGRGKFRLNETKLKMSLAQKGKPKSKEHKQHMLEHRADFSGDRNGRWRGGKQLRTLRKHNNRRVLGTINLNSPLECTVGHHINMDYIVYVPIWINKIPHNVRTGKNLGYVNALVLLWLCYTKEIDNCAEI